jgi:hypothetical protein
LLSLPVVEVEAAAILAIGGFSGSDAGHGDYFAVFYQGDGGVALGRVKRGHLLQTPQAVCDRLLRSKEGMIRFRT